MMISFSPGTVTALVGGDGAGKTSLLKTLTSAQGRAQMGVGALSTGEVGYQGATSGTWPQLTVVENLQFAARAHSMPRNVTQARIDALCEAARLDEARDRLASRLSGGMRQKLGVLMAMIHSPALLLLDEPTTGVDAESRQVLWQLIRRAAREGATVVVATTYLDEAEQADQVCVLDRGQLMARGSCEEVLASTPGRVWQVGDPLPRHAQPHPYAEASVPNDDGAGASKDMAANNPAATEITGSVPLVLNDAHTWQRGQRFYYWQSSDVPPPVGGRPVALDLELSTIASMLAREREASTGNPGRTDKHPESADPPLSPRLTYPSGIPLIKARQITKYFGDFTALDDVSLSLKSGEIVGLIGSNGAGKSTLIRILLGLQQADSGTVELFEGLEPRQARANIGYVPQTLGLYEALTPGENLAFTMNTYGAVKDNIAPYSLARTRPNTRRWKAGDWDDAIRMFPNVPVRDLPLGAKRRLAVACALSHAPRLLICDEPTSGMDALSRARLWKHLHRVADAGTGILITTHYQQEALQCDRLVLLEAGRLVIDR